MDTPPRRRGRPTLGAPRLTRADIVAATLTQIDEHGIADVSMRSVARNLGVDAKSLYNHVRDKDDLLDAVTEAILESIVVHVPTGDIHVDLAGIAYAFRDAALAHPEAAPLVLTRLGTSTAGLAPAQSILQVLLTAGFSPNEAVHLMRTLLATLVGTLLRETQGPSFGGTDESGTTRREAVLRGCGLRAVEHVAPELARFSAEAEFEYMIAVCIDAVLARAPRS